MTDNVTPLPDRSIVLDLDIEERDPKEVKPPFVVRIGGRDLTFADPADLDWEDLASVDVPSDLFRVSLSREDRNFLYDQKLPTWKFSKLLDAYSTHYDIDTKLEEARRQQGRRGI